MRPIPAESPHIRCTAPRSGAARVCDAKLADIVPGTVDVERADAPAAGCVVIICPRCGTRYRVCPTVGVGRAA